MFTFTTAKIMGKEKSITLGDLSDALEVIAQATEDVGPQAMANIMLLSSQISPKYVTMLIVAGEAAKEIEAEVYMAANATFETKEVG